MLLELLLLLACCKAGVTPFVCADDKPAFFASIPALDPEDVRHALKKINQDADNASADAADGADGAGPPLGVIGGTEPIFLEDIAAPFQARIDTGASLSSLDVENLKHFERDGKPWVSFEIRSRRDSTPPHSFERRVRRTVAIKQHGKDAVKRPMVLMTVRLGELSLRREFTLADRSKFKYPVLLGRNLLRGVALVDVSISNTLDKSSPSL